jgi:chorismate synthase
MRCDYDPFYQEVYEKNRITPDMHFLEKIAVFARLEKEIDSIRGKAPSFAPEKIREQYGVHPVLNCPDVNAAEEMVKAINRITATGDSSGGVVEVIALGLPVGLGEPVFDKLDADLGKMLGIGAVKSVEIGAGLSVKDMTGIQSNDAMHVENNKVLFDSNNAGGITGGLSNGAPLIVRLGVKPTPTIDKKQHTIDKYTLENKQLAAENFTAMVLLDNLIAHLGYQKLREVVSNG